ncbi:hypothetical protein niasHT_016723 [Heterodera trifolii]|uniref:Aminomethyltransferase folate-binding domain-containing protein n=1 Tax=Heterodera trifolii TaxID=157864 RepID=A0ABD2KU95_9BILA
MRQRQLRLVSKSLLLVHGAGAKQFLQGLTTKDMDSLNNVPVVYSFLLNVRGRILADFFIYRGNNGGNAEAFVLETEKSQAELLEKTLKLYRLRKQIGIEPLLDKTVLFRVDAEGGTTQKHEATIPENSSDWMADPRVPGFGFRAIRKIENETAHDDEASSSTYLRHRLAWGLAEGTEMVDQIPLNMNGDITGGISFEKGCYIGQELVARTHFTGIVRRRLMPFRPIGDKNGRDGFRDGFLLDERGKRQGKIICSHGQLGGLCLASLDIVPSADCPSADQSIITLSDQSAVYPNSDLSFSPSVRLFDSSGAAVIVHRPKWWPSVS